MAGHFLSESGPFTPKSGLHRSHPPFQFENGGNFFLIVSPY
jgi:hypothetical protein